MVCLAHTICGKGKYTAVKGNIKTQPKCRVCPPGRFRDEPATSSVAREIVSTVCDEHTKCVKGEYTDVAGTVITQPVCEKCPKGRYRSDGPDSSIVAESRDTCTALSAEFVFRTTADRTGQEINPEFVAIIVIAMLLALIFPTYKLIQVIIGHARAHKPQSKHDAALAAKFVLLLNRCCCLTCAAA